MGRLLALLLGGVGIVLYLPSFLPETIGTEIRGAVDGVLKDWAPAVREHGAGLLAAMALILFAVRGRE